MIKYLAHPNHPLPKHLIDVAEKAARFARCFGGDRHARLAGLLHDLGKAEPEFLKRICSNDKDGKKEPHALHGAALVLGNGSGREPVWPVALAINGHHAGLHNRGNVEKKRREYFPKAMAAMDRLKGDETWKGQTWPLIDSDFGSNLPDWLAKLSFDARMTSEGWLAVELYTRFLFSALIDADRLDTEENDPEVQKHNSPEKRRDWNAFNADTLLAKLNIHIQELAATAAKKASASVLAVRNEVVNECRNSASKDRGVFTLTVPTGGGKTLASMVFALDHAKAHPQIRRVIVVIPYLSIIQQTAKILADVFGEKYVLEHHSQAADPPIDKKIQSDDTDGYDQKRTRRQLAAENWDAPLIVTTSVQFFDSLFSRRPADARKLHNIAQSVIIFDEVQTLPPILLRPILDVLGELANPERPYGCSIVLCTATQPALTRHEDDFPCGLRNPRPIISDGRDGSPNLVEKHFEILRRTTYPELESKEAVPTLTWEQIAERLLASSQKQGLVVVNTRRHARDLFQKVVSLSVKNGNSTPANAIFHLSTWMTPAHRLEVLETVRQRLDAGQPCFLISTQCIEAGVDVDFPVVWRAFAPYDSIVQAGGRCNRNGNLPAEEAQVHIFKPKDGKIPPGLYETATNQTELLRKLDRAKPHDHTSFGDYFRLLYQLSVPDECEIQTQRGQLHFEEVNDLFHFIEDNSFPVLVRQFIEETNGAKVQHDTKSAKVYADAERRSFFLREDWRTFQRDIINLPVYNQNELISQHIITPAFQGRDESLYVLTGDAYYEGGLHGFGFYSGANYSERTVL